MENNNLDSYEKTIKSESIYDGKILSLKVDTVELPDKKYSKREIVDHKKGAGIIAFDGEDSIYMVRQYRISIDSYTLEIPAGLVDANEVPIDAARRELQEEIGYYPEDIEYLFDMHSSPGFTNDKLSLFLARDLKKSKLELDDDEFLEVASYKVKDLYRMIENGEITDAKTIIGIMYAMKLMNEEK